MIKWVNVVPVVDFLDNTWRVVEVDDIPVIVFCYQDEFYALKDVCTHDGGTLSDGDLEGCEIICPRHGARFDIRSGAVTAPPAYEAVPTYVVRVHEGMVQVADNPSASAM
ncbi:MAG: non-heme iron oxygenase ferredoxin subunit [Gammaproteobacteria bacterium]